MKNLKMQKFAELFQVDSQMKLNIDKDKLKLIKVGRKKEKVHISDDPFESIYPY